MVAAGGQQAKMIGRGRGESRGSRVFWLEREREKEFRRLVCWERN